MGQQIIEGYAAPSFSDVVTNSADAFPWSETEQHQIAEFRDALQQPGHVSLAARQALSPILLKGVVHPATRAEAIGILLHPQCQDTLKDVLDRSWTPELRTDLKERLVTIAGESDEAARIEQMAALAIRKSVSTLEDAQQILWAAKLIKTELAAQAGQGPLSAPYVPQDADSRQPTEVILQEGYGQVSMRGRKEFPTGADGKNATFLDLTQAFTAGDNTAIREILSQPLDFEQVFLDSGAEGLTVLIQLAESPEYRDMVLDLLHDQGSQFLHTFQELLPEHSQARKVIAWIQTGERPAPATAIAPSLAQIVADNDVNVLKTLIKTTDQRAAFIQELVEMEEASSPILVELLGDPDPVISVFAMDALYDQGSAAMDFLIEAEASANPRLQEQAKILTQAHFSGEPPASRTSSYDAPDPLYRAESAHSPDAFSFSAYLDMQALKQRFSTPETCLETLGLSIQSGPEAMSALCQLVLQS